METRERNGRRSRARVAVAEQSSSGADLAAAIVWWVVAMAAGLAALSTAIALGSWTL